jgi:hypothetical protein
LPEVDTVARVLVETEEEDVGDAVLVEVLGRDRVRLQVVDCRCVERRIVEVEERCFVDRDPRVRNSFEGECQVGAADARELGT